jgi:hypothetical protein
MTKLALAIFAILLATPAHAACVHGERVFLPLFEAYPTPIRHPARAMAEMCRRPPATSVYWWCAPERKEPRR